MAEDDKDTLPPADEELDNIDSEGINYYGKKNESITFKDIVLRAIETCRKEGSKEMSKGGQKTIFSKEINDYITINLPDQRKLYQQSILALYDLLLWYFDDDAKKIMQTIESNMQNAYKKFFDDYIKRETWEPYRDMAMRSGIIKTGKDSDVGIHYLHLYEEYIASLYRKMYQELILLYKRKNELSNVTRTRYYD